MPPEGRTFHPKAANCRILGGGRGSRNFWGRHAALRGAPLGPKGGRPPPSPPPLGSVPGRHSRWDAAPQGFISHLWYGNFEVPLFNCPGRRLSNPRKSASAAVNSQNRPPRHPGLLNTKFVHQGTVVANVTSYYIALGIDSLWMN